MGGRFAAVWLRHKRALAVFVLAAIGLAIVAGPGLLRPSRDNHFVWMAQGWLRGELALPGNPPGYCEAEDRRAGRCSGHRFDDWAQVTTLELRDGERLRGFPCRTPACTPATRASEGWWIIGRGFVELPRRDIVARQTAWYVSFPPGPAAVLLPVVALAGLRTPDVLLTLLLGALIPVVLLRLLDRERGTADGRGREHLWLACAWCFGSPALLLAAHGRVWFTGQIVGALALVLYLDAAWRLRRPLLAGLWLALAIACRPINHLPALLVFAWFWWHGGRPRAALLRFAVPLVLVGLAVAWLNWARFEDPFEFGHRFLETRWQSRIQSVGLFDLEYLPRNLQCLFTLMPVVGGLPLLRVSIHGMALWLSTPWLLLAPWTRAPERVAVPLLLAALGSAVPSLLYQNSGQIQFSYRFAVDWLPLVLLAMGLGGVAARRSFRVLTVGAVLVHLWGSWQFGRAPGRLFVTEPVGWPFEAELQQPAP
ncbi:MAG: hypothetical protein U0168_26715 [Nannocystaceae bacterium]